MHPSALQPSVSLTGYQTLIDHISKPAWLVDGQGQIYLVNAAWQEFFGPFSGPFPEGGCPRWCQELLDQTGFKRQGYAASPPRSRQVVRPSPNSSLPYTVEVQIEPLTGAPFWLGTATFLEKTDSVDAAHQLAAHEKALAKATQNQADLRRNIALVERILEHSQDCIKVLSCDGRLVYMNDGGQRLMEIDNFERDIRHTPWLTLWQGSDQDAAKAAFNQALAGVTARFDGYCATAKGTPKWWEVVVTPMFDDNETVQEILSVSRDITARKMAELALQARNEELDQFATVVSHDLKAPLRGISYLAEWLQDDLGEQLQADSRHQLQLLRQRSQRMTALVDGLLQHARAGRQQVTPEPVDLVELLDEIVDSLAPPAGLVVGFSPSLPTLKVKRVLLHQVLTNLVGNAIKHHHRDKGRVEVRVKTRGSFCEFTIADDGPGIPSADRDRVFDLFQTVHSSQSTDNTGIGLALVKKIIDSEGGRLWLECASTSTPNGGCSFCFTWPVSP